MEIIPVLNRITHDINPSSSSSFISRVFNFMGTHEISIQVYSLWAWGALFLAVIATFTGGINRAKLLIFRSWKGNSVISNPLFQPYEGDDDDEDDSSSSSVCSSDDEDKEDTEEEEEEGNQDDQDFRVAGVGNYSEDKGQTRKRKLYRRQGSKNRFSWADFTNGKSVVKLWEELGLGLGFESCSESVISMLDLNRNEITNSFLGGSSRQIPVVTAISPAVIMSGGYGKGSEKKAALRVWDSRTGRQIPEAIGEWIPYHRRSNQLGIDSDGLGLVYVSDDVSSTIRDLRKIGSPFETPEFDGVQKKKKKTKTFWEWEEL